MYRPTHPFRGQSVFSEPIWYIVSRKTFLFLIVTAITLLIAPFTRAVDPPPEGGYAGGNTALGTDALFSLTDGTWNTAIGENALHETTGGTANTAVGNNALFSNTP